MMSSDNSEELIRLRALVDELHGWRRCTRSAHPHVWRDDSYTDRAGRISDGPFKEAVCPSHQNAVERSVSTPPEKRAVDEAVRGEAQRARVRLRDLRGLLDAVEKDLDYPEPPGPMNAQAAVHAAADLAMVVARLDAYRRARGRR
jgi:hypothetical protein